MNRPAVGFITVLALILLYAGYHAENTPAETTPCWRANDALASIEELLQQTGQHVTPHACTADGQFIRPRP